MKWKRETGRTERRKSEREGVGERGGLEGGRLEGGGGGGGRNEEEAEGPLHNLCCIQYMCI